eukprot:494270-Pelagomonas_calceolata.AAC.1
MGLATNWLASVPQLKGNALHKVADSMRGGVAGVADIDAVGTLWLSGQCVAPPGRGAPDAACSFAEFYASPTPCTSVICCLWLLLMKSECTSYAPPTPVSARILAHTYIDTHF